MHFQVVFYFKDSWYVLGRGVLFALNWDTSITDEGLGIFFMLSDIYVSHYFIS
jgi:hypothetical protein